MGRAIIKLGEDKYIEWSSVVDAPVSYICTRAGMIDLMNAEYGRKNETEQIMLETDEHGCSAWKRGYKKLEDFIAGNRAGDKETKLTKEEILEKYTYKNEK